MAGAALHLDQEQLVDPADQRGGERARDRPQLRVPLSDRVHQLEQQGGERLVDLAPELQRPRARVSAGWDSSAVT
jgi:hypothetical protein